MEAGELLGLELILGNEQMMLGNVPTRGKGALRYDKKSAVIPQIETITRQVGGCCLKPTPGHVSYNTVLVGPIVSGTSCLLGPSGGSAEASHGEKRLRWGRCSLAPTQAHSSDSWGTFPWPLTISALEEKSICDTAAGLALLVWNPLHGAKARKGVTCWAEHRPSITSCVCER